jgi:hypothetical protein
MEEYASLRIVNFDYYILDLNNNQKYFHSYKFLKFLEQDQNQELNNKTIKIKHFYANESSTYNSFMERKIENFLIIRIFGSTLRGQKCCLNIHKYYPYFYIEITKDNYFDFTEKSNLRKFAFLLEDCYLAYINSNERKDKNFKNKIIISQIIHNIEKAEKRNFYGYYKNQGIFLKIYVYNPKYIPDLMNILNNGVINKTHYQCYESHLNLCMHFFSDFNLYGMSLIKFNKFSMRYEIKEKILLRNDIINYNNEEGNIDYFNCNKNKENNFLYHPRNIIWDNTIDILNEKIKKQNLNEINNDDNENENENDYINNCNNNIYKGNKNNYLELIKFSEDFKILDIFNLKQKQDKLIFNNLK